MSSDWGITTEGSQFDLEVFHFKQALNVLLCSHPFLRTALRFSGPTSLLLSVWVLAKFKVCPAESLSQFLKVRQFVLNQPGTCSFTPDQISIHLNFKSISSSYLEDEGEVSKSNLASTHISQRGLQMAKIQTTPVEF